MKVGDISIGDVGDRMSLWLEEARSPGVAGGVDTRLQQQKTDRALPPPPSFGIPISQLSSSLSFGLCGRETWGRSGVPGFEIASVGEEPGLMASSDGQSVSGDSALDDGLGGKMCSSETGGLDV